MSMTIPRTIITGTGHYVPPRVVTNFDLEKLMDTSDAWIRERSGIVERHHVDPGTGSSDLAVEAARLAIADAGIDPASIDFVVAATLSPDHYFPGIGVIVQAKLGLGTVGALDVRNQCSGFIYALSVADQYIRAGTYKRILLVAAEVQSSNLDFSDKGRDMSVLFGDGAGAVILEPGADGDGRGILSTHLFADGNFVTHLWMEKPSPKDRPTFQTAFFEEGRFAPKMDGRNVFVNACQRMPEAVRLGLEKNGLTVEDIDAPHPPPGQRPDLGHGRQGPQDPGRKGHPEHRPLRQHDGRLHPHRPRRGREIRPDQAGGPRRPDGFRVRVHLGFGLHPMVKADPVHI